MKDLFEIAEKDPKKEKILNKAVSNFSCKINEDIEFFLKDSTRGFKSKIKRIDGISKNRASITSYLIAQLGKNDSHIFRIKNIH